MKIAASLKSAQSSIVVCNSNDKDVQLLVNSINNQLGNLDVSNNTSLVELQISNNQS